MLATFAQFETDVRRERQAEGIARVQADAALRSAKYADRKPSVDRARVLELRTQGLRPSAIARSMGVSSMSVWRALEADEAARAS
jgi:DNA invertase Pin-like site-specific DNA recombinase